MKVKVSIELELPDNTPLVEGAELASLGELLSDTVVQYAANQHNLDAMKWIVKGRVGTPEEDLGAKKIYQFHETWADICSRANWSFEILDQKVDS